jgi:hypothetical protein
MQDNQLAALGDTYVNFIYSLAITSVIGKPIGVRVRDKVLAEALKNSGLREHLLPKRLGSHELSNAAESVIIYCWLQKIISLQESQSMLSSVISEGILNSREREWEDGVKAFTFLLSKLKERMLPS